MAEHTDQTHPNTAQTRVTVAEAAQLLGLSAEAVRSRVQRGTLKSTKVGNTVYVLLDEPAQTHPNGDQTEFIDSLQGQIDWLRREVERKDTLLMTLMQRIPELEPPRQEPPERRESPVTSSEEQEKGTGPSDNADAQNPSWWRRFFLGE